MTLTDTQRAEIALARADAKATLRPTVPALEEILYEPIPRLDHGFVAVHDYLGDDQAIADAARTSYGRGTRKTSDDAALIGYLMRHHHGGPFEMAEIKFLMKLPIFVARQVIRTRTASLNEVSARYSILDNEFYIPSPENMARQSATNNQGRGEVLDQGTAQMVLDLLKSEAAHDYDLYERLIDTAGIGLAREIGRMVLAPNVYTRWVWKIDARNLMNFLHLRTDAHAQYEVRTYADAMLDVLERWLPLTAAAFREYRLGAMTVSATGKAVIRRLLAGEDVTQETSGLGKREWRELVVDLGREA